MRVPERGVSSYSLARAVGLPRIEERLGVRLLKEEKDKRFMRLFAKKIIQLEVKPMYSGAVRRPS